MGMLFVIFVAAYALTGLVMDGAAAVRGHPLPSIQRRQARQKHRARRRENPSYLGTIWGNALESWADASTRRHNRRLKARDEWEKRKGPEWVERKLAKLEKAAARRERFAAKAGVLWGKARQAADNIRERRLEDEAWAANARFDAEQDNSVPAGLPGSTDLDDSDPAQDEAKVLPFPSRDDEVEPAGSVVHEHAKHSSGDLRPLHETSVGADLLTCLWGIEEGQRCTALKLNDSAYCGDHKLMDDRRCKWGDLGDGKRCDRPVHGRSPFCFEHHTADPELQASIEQRWGRPQSDTSPADQPDHGQDTNTETEKENTMSTPANAPAEITSLTDAIAYTQAMQDSLAAVDAQVDQWSADLRGFAEKARAANAEVETAIASLRNLGVEGNQIAALESAREQLENIAAVFDASAKHVATASDSAQAGSAAFGQARQAFTAQTGIQEQMQAAAASGYRAGKREFYEVG